MEIPETGDVVTPVDDPCQYNPAWRSIVACYLFSEGVRNEEDLKGIAMSGSVTVVRKVEVDEPEEPEKKPAKGKKPGARAKKKARRRTEIQKVARPIAPFDTNPEYRAFASDAWIARQISMYDDEACGHAVSEENAPLKLAFKWYSEMDHEAAMKKRLEPLLLTEVGMDVVTLDLTGQASAQPAIEAYERLYFNCRDDDFKLHPSMQLVQRMAMPWGPLKTYLHKWEEVDADGYVIGDGRPLAKDSDVWRAIAATMGYEALMYVWKWDKRAHGMKNNSVEHMLEISWKVAASRLFSDLYNGDIKHEDAARVLAAYTAQSKRISDERSGLGGGEESTVTKALMAILYQTSPSMITISADEEAGRNDEIQSRIQSQLAITRQEIEDAGEQVNQEVMNAQIASAIDSE